MKKLCLFAGTTEGRILGEFLAEFSFDSLHLTLCVATEYGEELLHSPYFTVVTKRMSREDMQQFLPVFDLVIDCTHPYATVVTEYISSVCEECAVEYLRICRENIASSGDSNLRFVESMEDMVTYLQGTSGNILSTLGSKELHHFKGCDFVSRLYARVLPMADSLVLCGEIQLPPSRILALQGPFSYNLNRAMVEAYDIKIMLTKDSGKVGGFEEKVEIARTLGVELLVLSKPLQKVGLTLEQGKEYLRKKFNLSVREEKKLAIAQKKSKFTVVSCGVGRGDLLSEEGRKVIESADMLLGATRLLDVFAKEGQKSFSAYSPEKIRTFLDTQGYFEQIVLLVTGDCGFFSGGKGMKKAFPEFDCCFIAGISSLNYLASCLQIPWEESHILSLHGRNANIIAEISRFEKTFLLFGGEHTVEQLCQILLEYELDVTLCIGENLSYETEKITVGSAKELINQSFSPLSCGFVLNDSPLSFAFGLPEDSFYREDKVPMTKSEVRAVTLSKLNLREQAIIYDIGAGTGSVSVEMAGYAIKGTVYAMEQKESAISVLKENKKRFLRDNIEILCGDALELLKTKEDLPPPTHIFVGGYSGSTKDLLEVLERKVKEQGESREKVPVVFNTVTLETLAELSPFVQEYSAEVVEISVAKGEKRGRYHMMLARNPVFVISFLL